MPTRYSECVICRKPAATRSRFCDSHKARLTRYGSPNGKALPMKGKRNAFDLQMRIARRYLQLFAESPAVAAAARLAEELMSYKAETRLTADMRLQEVLNYQRDCNADPLELVARVVAFYLFMAHKPHYFSSDQKAEDCALGRLVCHVVALGGHRWSAAVYVPAGQLARTLLGPFALRLIDRVERDAASVQSLVKASAQL